LTLFGFCVLVAEAVLPWEPPARIAAGAGAGAVVVRVLVAWTSWMIPPKPTRAIPYAVSSAAAAGSRSVRVCGDSFGVIVAGDGNRVHR
jgi:hypothetical protein